MFDTAEYFNSLDMFGIRLGLAATNELMERAGHPEKNLRFIHIAGTNGKGSTGAMLERSLRQAGLRTGFYTSPHLIDIKERFRINGSALFEKLGGQKRFVRVGASYIVNLDYVLRIMPDTIELMGNHTIPIPRRALAELKQKYFDYYCDMEEL